jgi:acetyltransferase-like isoleucine patch superfamily enzyme
MIGIFRRLWWFWKADRLGPDIPVTHFLLYFPKLARWICRKKFRHFGEGSEFRPHAFADYTNKISIGNNVVIRPGTFLFADEMPEGTITIEDDIGMGGGVHIYVTKHRFDLIGVPIKYQGYYQSKPVRICKGSWIGANSVILLGVTIGENAVVGAGAVVTKDVEPYTVVAGNPARVIRRIK